MESRPCNIRGLRWSCQSIWHGQPHPTIMSPTKICRCNSNNLLWQYLCAQDRKKTVEIPQSVGVHQGDNMAPVLFLFLMTAFAETLEIVWKQQEIPVISVMTATGDNMIHGRICSHTPTMFKSKNLTAYEILQCIYVNDGAFPFSTRDDLQKGMSLIYHHFSKFGMEMHIEQGTSMSKTECIFFPPPQFFQHSQQLL